MRNKLVAAAITGLAVAPAMAQAEAEVSWFGFTQITAEQVESGNTSLSGPSVDGRDKDAWNNENNDGIYFGADRVRIGYKAQFDSGAFSKLMVDFNKGGTDAAGVPNIIKDAVVGYDAGMAKVRLGLFKTPVGMDFNTSGKKLDITKRGMEKDFVLERAAGGMLSAGSGPVSVDVGMFDLAHRGKHSYQTSTNNNGDATGASTQGPGGDYSYAARVNYDMGKMLHAEASYGVSENSGYELDDGTEAFSTDNPDDPEDYQVLDVGVKANPLPALTLKAEYLSAQNVDAVDGDDQTVWFAHAGYMVNPMVEVVARHYSSSTSLDDTSGNATDSDLTNTYLGANVFLNPEKHHEARLQVNYVMAGGDDGLDGDAANHGTHRGYVDDAILVQAQTSF